MKRPQVPGQRPWIYTKNQDIWDAWDFAGFELRRAVAYIYGKSIEAEIENAVNARGSVAQEIGKLKPGDCVISFNYDLLDERILEKRHKGKWVRAYPWLDFAGQEETIILCKPHGSLNWLQRVPENGRRVQLLPEPMREDEIDYKKGATLQPGIVGPVPFKSEIIVPEIQGSVNSFHELLVAQWSWAMRRISEAQELVIMGYGFPAEDLHARFLFKEAIANRKNQS